jgi:hypothetical protein
MNGDYCPDMGECPRCSRPMCTNCMGDSQPWECTSGDEVHCTACGETCPSCQDALEDAAVES